MRIILYSEQVQNTLQTIFLKDIRGGEWYLEKRGSRKSLAGSRNLGSVFDKSRSLVFSWFVFTFFESRNFSPKSLGLRFLTRISASRRVSDFTIRHPWYTITYILQVKIKFRLKFFNLGWFWISFVRASDILRGRGPAKFRLFREIPRNSPKNAKYREIH